jgi:hypothetical protein
MIVLVGNIGFIFHLIFAAGASNSWFGEATGGKKRLGGGRICPGGVFLLW